MEWISQLNRQTITEQVENLTLRETNLISFNRESFKSRHLPQTFRNYCFTDLSSARPGLVIEFMLRFPTQYEAVCIFMTVSIDLDKEFVKYSSYPAKHSSRINFTSQQIVALGRIFSLHLNSRLNIGWLSIDPESGCLTYQHANNSLGFLARRIEKVPEELTSHLFSQVKQLQKNWRSILPKLFNLLHLSERKNLSHPFWKNPPRARNHNESPEFSLLTEYVKHSFIEYPQMFDQTLSRTGKRIRSRVLPREEKNKKYLTFKNQQDSLNYCSQPFSKEVYSLLQLYVPQSTIDQELKSIKKELPNQKVTELCEHLNVNNYEPRTEIYSQLRIHSVRKEEDLSRSAFSQLKLLLIEGQKQEDPQLVVQKIVTKDTDQKRFINQSQILKFMGQGKSFFITRYFFSDLEPKKILLEYCPQKSINSYIAAYKQIISFETKIVLMNRLALGVRFLRDYGVHHNDLKPENILLKVVGTRGNNNNHLLTRLIDFGESLSKYQMELNRTNVYRRGWTIPYAPPEQVKYSKYSEKTDSFSIGVILYEFIFGGFPPEAFSKGKELYMKEDCYRKLCSMAPEKCRDYSCPKLMQVVYQLFLRCVHPNPDFRPSIDWICIILKDIVIMAERISSL